MNRWMAVKLRSCLQTSMANVSMSKTCTGFFQQARAYWGKQEDKCLPVLKVLVYKLDHIVPNKLD